MTKLKFIDSLRNEKERDKDTVETTVTEMMILELKELLRSCLDHSIKETRN